MHLNVYHLNCQCIHQPHDYAQHSAIFEKFHVVLWYLLDFFFNFFLLLFLCIYCSIRSTVCLFLRTSYWLPFLFTFYLPFIFHFFLIPFHVSFFLFRRYLSFILFQSFFTLFLFFFSLFFYFVNVSYFVLFGLEGRGIIVRFSEGPGNVLFSTASTPAVGPTQPPSWYKVMDTCIYTITPPIRLHGIVLN
jgi:hypothetical protein